MQLSGTGNLCSQLKEDETVTQRYCFVFSASFLSNKEKWTNESDLLLIFFQVGLKIRCSMSMPSDFHPLNPLVLLGIKCLAKALQKFCNTGCSDCKSVYHMSVIQALCQNVRVIESQSWKTGLYVNQKTNTLIILISLPWLSWERFPVFLPSLSMGLIRNSTEIRDRKTLNIKPYFSIND